MSSATYNNQILTRYLLGALPETETERLDELSTTDDEFADTLKSAEDDLVDAYVQGELSGTALRQFESYYLASPLRRQRVQFAQAFQNFGTKALVTEHAGGSRADHTHPAVGRKSSGGFSALMAALVARPALQWGLAVAALVLLIGGGTLLIQNVRLRQQMAQTQARRDEFQTRERELQTQLESQRGANAATEKELAQVRDERARLEEELKRAGKQPSEPVVASFILTPQLRGAEQTKTVTIPSATELVTMQLQLEPNEYSTFSAALIDQSSHRVLWRSGRVKARGTEGRKSVNVSFRADLLHPGIYQLRVSATSATGASDPISDYSFKVVR
jgi:anti-sigma factor RsiW